LHQLLAARGKQLAEIFKMKQITEISEMTKTGAARTVGGQLSTK
jgi:hypothetical protein